MGQAKRRKQILGDAYGQPGTVNQTIVTAKKKNDALLPKGFLPDFGLEIAAQIGEEPFHLLVAKTQDLKVLKDSKRGRVAVNFVPLQLAITRVAVGVKLPGITKSTLITLEISTPDNSKVDAVIDALNCGIDVKANWSKRYMTKHPEHKELVVPIHLLPDEEDRLGLQHIADYI